MNSEYLEFFNLLPKTAQLEIRTTVSEEKELKTDILGAIFIKHGVFKKKLIDNLKECTDRVVARLLGKAKDQTIIEFQNMTLSDECEIFLNNFVHFYHKFQKELKTDTITAYVSYIMMCDKRLKVSKLISDCIYVKSAPEVESYLLGILEPLVGRTDADIKEFGEFLINPLYYHEYNCFGREEEIQQCLNILCRKDKSNVVLVGSPGVGKTKIVEGLCNVLQEPDCPEQLRGNLVFSLRLNNLIKGTMYRGDLEKKLSTLLDYLLENKNTILFIDEIHGIFSESGKDDFSGTSTSMTNIFKPYLTKGLKVIGCTTQSEYKVFHKDKAFERRFSKVLVRECNKEQAFEILRNCKQEYEKYHNLKIDDTVCRTIINLCNDYIKDKYFPDKAFDVIDVSCVIAKNRKSKVLEDKDIETCIYNLCGINPKRLSYIEIVEKQNNIKNNLIGQDKAIDSIGRHLLRYYRGLCSKKKPIGNFLFVGPTGVGKTELCKQVAEQFFNRDSFIRYDMSEFLEKHSISKLIGAPPGYVGFRGTDTLCDKVKNNPFCVILFDEIEKAHPEVLNLLLQIMDDGRLTDSSGNTVDFSNTLICMTSNIGCKEYMNKKTIGFNSPKNDIDIIKKSIKTKLSPEFCNRLDDIILFNKIDKESFGKILQLEIDNLIKAYKESGIELQITDNAIQQMQQLFWDEENGVRWIRKNLHNTVNDITFQEENYSKTNIIIDYDDGFYCKEES